MIVLCCCHFETNTAGAILSGVGSIGLSLIFWVIGYLFAGGLYIPTRFVACTYVLLSTASLAAYLEYASYFPHRSGAEVAYLEKVLLGNQRS